MIFRIILIILGGLVVLGLIISWMETSRLSQRLKEILIEIDEKYEDFVSHSITSSVLKNNSLEIGMDQLISEIMIILKPHISGLASFIDSVNYSSLAIRYTPRNFSNITSVISALFRQTKSGGKKLLDSDQKQSIEKAFLESIQSDLTQRIANLKSGDF